MSSENACDPLIKRIEVPSIQSISGTVSVSVLVSFSVSISLSMSVSVSISVSVSNCASPWHLACLVYGSNVERCVASAAPPIQNLLTKKRWNTYFSLMFRWMIIDQRQIYVEMFLLLPSVLGRPKTRIFSFEDVPKHTWPCHFPPPPSPCVLETPQIPFLTLP